MKLKEYLDMNGIKYSFFAEKLKITRQAFHKILHGQMKVSLIMAKKIVEQTSGKVTYEDLIFDKINKKKPTKNKNK